MSPTLSQIRVASLLAAVLVGALSASAQQPARARVDFSTPFELAGPAPFEPFAVRDGMPNLRRKLEAGQPVTVGFLGGSITQNAEKEGFIEAFRAWVAKKYPSARVRTINAGIPATNSNWGAARVGHDLLGEKPDAVFVEFAVNDGERDSRADMESIVRRIRQADPETDVAFLYATSEPAFNNKLRKGKTHEAIRFHEAVAAHYALPALTFGTDLYRQIESGRRPWSDFFHDDCHPLPEGYASYSRDLEAFMTAVFEAPKKNTPLPGPLVAEAPAMAPVSEPEPMRDPEPMIDRDLGQATDTWALPVLGAQWIGSASFPREKEEWQVSYAILPDGTGGAPRSGWLPARWFPEGRGFTGNNSYVMAKASEKWGSTLSMFPSGSSGGVLLPQVTWTAPKPGRYICKLQAGSVAGNAQNDSATAGLDVFRLRKASPSEDRIGAAAALPGGSFVLNLASDLTAGDRLIFRLHSSNFEFCSVESVEISIGRFETAGQNLSRVR